MLKAIRVIALSFVLSLSMLACKKSSDSPSSSYNLTAKFDGQSKSFNTQVLAIKTQMGEGYNLIISALNGTKESFSIDLWSDMDGFHNGDVFYHEAVVNDTENLFGWASDMLNSNETTVWSSFPMYLTATSNIKVTITEITNEYVKGTFSGTIYQNVESSPSKSITDGQFMAKF